MRSITLLSIILAFIFIFTSPVQAKHHYSHQRVHTVASYAVDPGCNIIFPCAGVSPSPRGVIVARKVGFGEAISRYTPERHSEATQIVSHPEGCPSRAFCGCGAAVRVFGKPVRELWLASNWYKFPRSTPAPGNVAVSSHHVFVLEADLGGGVWQVYDANSGSGLTRIHGRSISGYTIVNPHA